MIQNINAQFANMLFTICSHVKFKTLSFFLKEIKMQHLIIILQRKICMSLIFSVLAFMQK